MRINTALILCAGFGKRLNPITLNTPKPLLEIKDVSTLERCINLIEKLGIQKILINTFYLKDQFSVFLDSKNFNIDIKIIEDGEHILDTGGGIQNMIKDSNEKDFIIFNPDTIWSKNYKEEILKMEKIYFSEKLENILLLANKKLSFDKKLKGDFNLKNNLINKDAEKEFIYIGCQIINKKLFIKESRIVAGVKFYSENKDLIMQVAEIYNVDPFIILSIAGIESNYGKHYKGFTVFNSLYTQIHEMPKRAKWASKELASYLEYCFKDNVDPQSIEGSYAGAFGFGQFIPSSFNRYSVDFDNDGVRRPHDWPDVVGSIAHYLIKNGYIPGSSNYSKGGDIWKSVWAYNHSDNYVMAVLGLTEKIRDRSSYLYSNVENRLNYVIENFDPLDNKSVSDLQKALNANGYNLEIDGRLGGKTLDALREAQSKRN